jgi:phosphatidate cytidylyltransferase
VNAQKPAAAPRARDTLILRIASAAVLAPAAIGATWLGGPVFAGLVAFMTVLMCFEWSRMIERREFSPAFYALAIPGAAATIFASAGRFEPAFAAAALASAAAAFAVRPRVDQAAWLATAGPYFIAPSVALLWLREHADYGRGLTLLLFAIVWAADTGAYFAGRIVGGPKLSPTISPAKTWAGAAGGFLLGGLAGMIGGAQVYGGEAYGLYAAMGGVLGVASILGDLAESAFKRNFGIKDMSGFIPGHGGVLDRLDGMIFATAAMTAVLYAHMLMLAAKG